MFSRPSSPTHIARGRVPHPTIGREKVDQLSAIGPPAARRFDQHEKKN